MVRIAIPTPTTTDLAYNQRCWPAYAEAIRTQGAEPVEIPLDLPDPELKELADTCEAILLPGSPADVLPSRYGQDTEEHTSPADANRESTDLFLLDHAYQTKKPVLGVCFGCQILNVYHGGTLLQDLSTIPVNHPSARGVAVAHAASVAPSSLLASVCNVGEAPEVEHFMRLPVNSSHHQADRHRRPGPARQRPLPPGQRGRSHRRPHAGGALRTGGPVAPRAHHRLKRHVPRPLSTPRRRSRQMGRTPVTPTLADHRIATLLEPYYPHPAPLLLSQLSTYLDLLLKWNNHTNLTAIRNPDEIVQRHFGESLFAARHLPKAKTLLDLGSGAGFPGLPIQLAHPSLEVTLAESQNKKASFLREVIRTLDLPTKVWAQRSEQMSAEQRFDVVALRAVDNPEQALTEARRRLGPEGVILHLGGQRTERAIPMPGLMQSWLLITP